VEDSARPSPGSDHTRRRWLARVSALVVLAFLLAYSWLPAGVSAPNERARIYLSIALVDHRTVVVDTSVQRFGKIFDLAERDGHFYSDKAPGSSFLGAAVYWPVRVFSKASEWDINELITLMRICLMIPIGLLGVVFLRRLLRLVNVDPVASDLAVVGWILGSAAFHTSAAFMGHQIVAVSLIGALWLLLEAEARAPELETGRRWSTVWRCLAAGGFAGMAGFTEYQSAAPAFLISAYVLCGPLRKRPAIVGCFFAGALPFVVALMAYNNAAFGGITELSYHHLIGKQQQEIHGSGIGGVTAPHWAYAHGALFSLHRGLFTCSPLFLLVIPGVVSLWRHHGWRLASLVGLSFLCYVYFISSTQMWYAGWGFGPRLLVPALGWASIAVAAAIGSLRKNMVGAGVVVGLLAVSIGLTQSVQAVFPELPERFINPIPDVVVPALSQGLTAPNLGMTLFGLSGLASLLPLAVVLTSILAWLAWRACPAQKSILGCAGALLVSVLVFGPYLVAIRYTTVIDKPQTDSLLQWMNTLLRDEPRLK